MDFFILKIPYQTNHHNHSLKSSAINLTIPLSPAKYSLFGLFFKKFTKGL